MRLAFALCPLAPCLIYAIHGLFGIASFNFDLVSQLQVSHSGIVKIAPSDLTVFILARYCQTRPGSGLSK